MRKRNFWIVFWILLSVLGAGYNGVDFQNSQSIVSLIAMILWGITGCAWIGVWTAFWSDED